MAAVTLLSAVTATGAGPIKLLPHLVKDHTVQVTTTGDPTAVTIDLEGSLDGVTWFQLFENIFDAGEITADAAIFHVLDAPVGYVRCNLTTLTGGTTPTVTALYEGDSTIKNRIGRRGQF